MYIYIMKNDTKQRNWSSCTKLALGASWTYGLITQSVRASEQNSLVMGSNPTQANFPFYSYFKESFSGKYIYIYSHFLLPSILDTSPHQLIYPFLFLEYTLEYPLLMIGRTNFIQIWKISKDAWKNQWTFCNNQIYSKGFLKIKGLLLIILSHIVSLPWSPPFS